MTDGKTPKTFAKTEIFEEKDGYYTKADEVTPSLKEGGLSNKEEACGAPIIALEGGLVVEMGKDGWNEGRGSYLSIEGTKITTYLHLGDIHKDVGELVSKGDLIASAGRSGLPSNSPCVRETE